MLKEIIISIMRGKASGILLFYQLIRKAVNMGVIKNLEMNIFKKNSSIACSLAYSENSNSHDLTQSLLWKSKMKKILLLTLLMTLNVINAEQTELVGVKETASPFLNAKKGINIVPLADMNIPPEVKKHILNHKKLLLVKGYEETTDVDQDVVSLLKLPKSAKDEITKFDTDNHPYDTHLKSSASKIRLRFPFKEIPGRHDIIGFAAAGGYKKESGWDGVVEFINHPQFGVCAYTTYSIEKVVLDKETTEYLVNNKPTIKSIAGNWNTGFRYVVTWYLPDRQMSLQCANKMYKADILNGMIQLAQKIV